MIVNNRSKYYYSMESNDVFYNRMMYMICVVLTMHSIINLWYKRYVEVLLVSVDYSINSILNRNNQVFKSFDTQLVNRWICKFDLWIDLHEHLKNDRVFVGRYIGSIISNPFPFCDINLKWVSNIVDKWIDSLFSCNFHTPHSIWFYSVIV